MVAVAPKITHAKMEVKKIIYMQNHFYTKSPTANIS